MLRDIFDTCCPSGPSSAWCKAVVAAREINARQDLPSDGARRDLPEPPARPGRGGCRLDLLLPLAAEDHRDADTWGIHLLDLADQGLRPEATIADGGTGLRAAQKLVWPSVPCRADVFHAQRDVGQIATYLENRALGVMTMRDTLERRMVRAKRRGQGKTVSKKLALARQREAVAVGLADDVAVLATWLQADVLTLAGPDHATRRGLFDFIVEELRARESLCPHRIGPVRRMLENQRDDLLAFVEVLDGKIAALATEFQVAPEHVRSVLALHAANPKRTERWHDEAELRGQLGGRFYGLFEATAELARDTVRASSVIENVNSRLRPYFFLRREIGPAYLDLLRFFLNHRTFLRSERPEREGRSPAEILAGEPHPHWLSLLGFERFRRN